MKRISILVCCVFLLLGCHPRVWLDPGRFQTQLNAGDFSAYKGKDLQVVVILQATNADDYYYYSNGSGTRYTSYPSMEDFMDSAIRKSIASMGMTVYVAPPQLRIVPEMRIFFNSLSDVLYATEVQVLIDKGIKLSEHFTVKMPPPDKDATIEDLEKRAYRMVDMLVAEIFRDPRVQAVVTQDIPGSPKK